MSLFGSSHNDYVGATGAIVAEIGHGCRSPRVGNSINPIVARARVIGRRQIPVVQQFSTVTNRAVAAGPLTSPNGLDMWTA